MFRHIMTSALLAGLLMLSLPGNAALGKVGQDKSCYSGPFENYDDFIDVLVEKKKKLPAPSARAKLEMALPKQDFTWGKTQARCDSFLYQVDGVNVLGYKIVPNIANSDQPLPVVIYNRGGNAEYGSLVFGQVLRNLIPIAKQGYIVLASNYRGGLPGQDPEAYGRDEFGGKDVDDVKALIEMIESIPEADPNRIALFGWSRGGMMNFLTARNNDKIKAVVTVAGDNDLNMGLSIRPEMERVYKARIPDYAVNKSESLKQRSVIEWADELPKEMPVLLLYGQNDQRVSALHGIKLAEKFQQTGQPYKLVIYPEADHSLLPYRDEAMAEIFGWLDAHL
ncbi:alpha/beta hydrolase family protein [Ferrimonas pelagia]|uniref:Peptidase S9 prolyl oligopeptidase catalytic domain-containing protein n=1 Tax=Ferrimonas pelagia TaxID=1177826 RepID=A0ABP9FH04_9GAMM